MLKRKKIREKGKIRFGRYFQNLKSGERVSVVRELSRKAGFPKSIQGKSGIVEWKRGDCYIIKIKLGKNKRFIIHPVHLKKIEA